MLLGWTVMAATAGVPTGMAALGDDIVEMDVREIITSPGGAIVMAVTESQVIPLAGEAAGTELSAGGIVAADVSDEGWIALAHGGGVTIHDHNGRELLRLGGFTGLADIALSPDGLTFAVSTADRITAHRTADGLALWDWKGETYSVTYHPDGRKVITGIPTGNLVLDSGSGRVLNGFDTKPAVWFQWSSAKLYTHEEGGVLKTWNPVTLEPLDAEGSLTIQDTAAVHPDGSWLLIDGCVTPAGATRPTSLCVGDSAVASAFSAEGELFVATDGWMRTWTPLDERRVTDLGLPPGGPRVTGIAAADGGDWVVVTNDGMVRRLAADGSAKFEATVPGCGGTSCDIRALGGHQQDTWVLGPRGEAQSWSATGSAQLKGRRTDVLDAGRMPDGTWVSLMDDGRVRMGPKPGKGKVQGEVPGARGLAVGIEGFVAIGDVVQPFNADGLSRPVARLGPERTPRAVTVDESGLALAVIDDQGNLHRFSPDGRPVFREPLALPESVDEIAWSADGAWLVVAGSPLRVFDASDGSPHMDVILSPPGAASALATSPFGFIGVVQGSDAREEVRLVRLR